MNLKHPVQYYKVQTTEYAKGRDSASARRAGVLERTVFEQDHDPELVSRIKRYFYKQNFYFLIDAAKKKQKKWENTTVKIALKASLKADSETRPTRTKCISHKGHTYTAKCSLCHLKRQCIGFSSTYVHIESLKCRLYMTKALQFNSTLKSYHSKSSIKVCNMHYYFLFFKDGLPTFKY